MMSEILRGIFGNLPPEYVPLLALGYMPLKLSLHLLGRTNYYDSWDRLEKFSMVYGSGFVLIGVYHQLTGLFVSSIELLSLLNILFVLISILGASVIDLIGFLIIALCSELAAIERLIDGLERKVNL